MTKFNASIAAAAAALLLSGNAFAASLQPAAGEGPFFNEQPTVSSSLQRADVRADASGHMPAAGELNAQADAVQGSAVTRAEVRQQTREDIAHGCRPAAGDA